MTFEQLRSKATAAETCLIDTIILMVEKEVTDRTKIKIKDFIKLNAVPTRDDVSYDPTAYQRWFARLDDYVNSPSKQ